MKKEKKWKERRAVCHFNSAKCSLQLCAFVSLSFFAFNFATKKIKSNEKLKYKKI